jgi:GNAT acetyltransferase
VSGLADLDLLQAEFELLWPSAGPEMVIACAREGLRVQCGSRVPAHLAATLAIEAETSGPSRDLDTPPHELARWRAMLEDELGEPITLTSGSGPSYLVDGTSITFPTGSTLIRSDGADLSQLRAANPGNWAAEEWLDLLAGRLGPWVMATQGPRIVSICHTPVSNAEAAEAGVWTHPDFRGRGLASATTAEWTALVGPTRRLLFYSASRFNRSSLGVAARLGLRRIGTLWQLRPAAAEPGWTTR